MSETNFFTLNDLKAKAVEFRASWESSQRVYNSLDAQGKAKFQAEFGAMQAKANSIIKTLATIGGAYDKAVKTIDDVFKFFSSQLNGLGILPAVPVVVSSAIIAGSIAAMSYFIKDSMDFSKRMKIYNGLIQQKDLTPSAALDIVERLESSGGFLGGIASPVKGVIKVAGLVGAAFVGYKFYENYQANK